MKKVYLDRTKYTDCMAVYVRDAQVENAGATVYAMPVKDKNDAYERFAQEHGIWFIFADDVPQIAFFAVPQVDVFAHDGAGGYIGMAGQTADLQSDAPVVYIDAQRRVYMLAERGAEFVANAGNWREKLVPWEGIRLYNSREEAEKDIEFLELSDEGLPAQV